MTSSHIEAALHSQLGGRWAVRALDVSSFCDTWCATALRSSLFVKSVPASKLDVLSAEADGLRALANGIRVPAVRDCWVDSTNGLALLALEWLQFAPADESFGVRLGRDLRALHRSVAPGGGRFGWSRNNMIGATPQSNAWSSACGVQGWIEFLRSERFGAMQRRLSAAQAPADLIAAIEDVTAALPSFFEDAYEPRASLIHGDLWSGNWAMLEDRTPVIYDPAVSCSDAEAELAMMELFGEVPPGFWQGYGTDALSPGYVSRRELYQLYHLLNHALLFGGGYVSQALRVARRLAL